MHRLGLLAQLVSQQKKTFQKNLATSHKIIIALNNLEREHLINSEVDTVMM